MLDSEIIDGIREGNEEIFLKYVNQYKNKVISLCYSYTSDYQEAEDLSQEVFLTLFRSIHGFRGDCLLSTYLYRIAVTRCLDYKRKKSIKGFLSGLLNHQSQEAVDIDDKNYIRQCVLGLPEDLKTPIILYYYIGLSQREIGDVLKLSEKTVEGRIYRAKKKLKKEFEKGDELICSKNGTV